jgi:hypothetical protein
MPVFSNELRCFNKQKQFHHDSLIMRDIYIVMIYAYDVNNIHSSAVWSTRDITLSQQG